MELFLVRVLTQYPSSFQQNASWRLSSSLGCLYVSIWEMRSSSSKRRTCMPLYLLCRPVAGASHSSPRLVPCVLKDKERIL